jgi:autotransporter-associated beta strand protein
VKKFLAVIAILSLVFSPVTPAFAATYYWDTTGSMVWETGANWSDNADEGGVTGVVPGEADSAVFNQSAVNNDMTFQLGANHAIAGITIKNTGTTLIDSNLVGTTRTLTLGTGGITVNEGAGAATIGWSNQPLNITLAGAQAWTNNSGNTLTIVNDVTNGANLLTVAGGGSTTITGVISGDGGLTKSGAGTLILTNSGNSYSGDTSIDVGALRITDATALGSSNVTVATGAALELDGAIAADLTSLTLNGSGVSSGGVLRNVSGANTMANDIVLGSSSRISNGGGSLALSGGISGTGDLTLAGGDIDVYGVIDGSIGALTFDTGDYSLAAANGYTGLTTITSSATLVIQDEDALGATGSGTIVASGSSLMLEGLGSDMTVTGEALTINGNGSGAFGVTSAALLNFSDNNTWTGDIALASNASIGSETGLLTITGGVSGNFALTVLGNDSTILSGVISTASLTKEGAPSTLTLNGAEANTYAGLTTVSAGTLVLDKDADGTTAVAGNISVGGGTLQWNENNQVANTSSITMTSGAVDLNGMDETVTSFSNSGGTFTTGAGHLTGTGATVTWSGGTNTVNADGVVEDAHIVITGGTNTVEGQGAGTTGGVLQLNAAGAGLEMTGSTLTLNSDAGVAGKLLLKGNVSTNASASTSTIANGLALANKGTVDLDGGTRTFTVANGAAATDMSISAVIANGGLTKTGAGTLTLSGANTYAGATTLTLGTLRAETDAAALGAGALVLNGGTLQLASDAPTNFGRATTVGGDVTIESDTVTAVAGVTQTLGTLSIGANTLTVNEGGNATGATSGLTFGATTLTGAATINSNTIGLTTLGAVTGTGNGLTVTGAGNTTLSGGLNTSTGGTLTKSGTGTFTLSSAGSYTGATAINAGVVDVQNNTSLGTTTGTTTVASGAAVQIDGNGLTIAEAITLNGSGVSGGGALRNLANDNAWTGAITLGAVPGGARINSDGGTLTLSTGGITGEGQNLTVGGAGHTTISGIIGTTTGGVTKDGSGTLTLSGANTYTGATSITAGKLVDSGSIADTSNVTVNGATAIFDLGASHNDTVGTVTLQGGGQITGTGTSALTSSASYVMQNGSVTAILAGTGGLNKTTADTVTLSGANAFTGATAVSGGTLTLSGTAGAVAASSGVAISGGSTLDLANTAAANNTDRLKNTGTVTMNGGTLNFSNDNSANTFAETTGALTIASGANTISASQAVGGSSTLTFASIAHTAGTVNFTGTGLGVDAQNKIMFATGAATTLGAWATYNGTGFASYDEALGVIGATYVDIDARGPSTIVDGLTTNVRILGDGTAGNIALGSATTTINTLLQSNSDFAAIVDTADKTLRVGSIMIGTGKEALTIGAAVGDGTLTAAIAGGELILINNSGNALTINAVVANNTSASSLTVDGTGVVTLAGANTYSGTTLVSAGTLALGNINAVQNSTLDVGISGTQSVTFTVGGTNTYNLGGLQGSDDLGLLDDSISVGANNSSTEYSGVLSGTGGLTKVGTGTFTLSGVNTYTGKTALNGGTVKISAESGLGGDPGGFAADQLSFNGGTLQTTATFSIDDSIRGMTLGAGGGTFSPDTGTILTIANVITGAGALTMAGAGTLTLTGDNTYTGVTTFTAGTLSVATIGNGGATGDLGAATAAAANLVFNGGTLQYTGTDASTDRNFTINAGKTATISVSEASTELTMSGAAAAGTGALTKTGAGTLILTGANANTGITTVSAGTLQVGAGGAAGALGTGNIVDNATLVFNRSDEVTVTQAISGTGDVTHAGTSILNLNGANTYTGTTTVSSTGTLNVNTDLAMTEALNFAAAGTVQIANGKSVASAIDNTTGGNGVGTVNFLGASTVGGEIGGTRTLFDVNMAGLVTSSYDISATTINIGTNGTFKLTGDIATAGTLTTEAVVTSVLNLQSYTMTHTGALTFGADSTLMLDINGAAYGNADVTGAVTLPSTVGITVNAISESMTGDPIYVILGTAGAGVDGGNEVTDNSYVWSFTADTDDNQDLYLTPTREHPLNTLSSNSNVDAVGAALEGARATTTNTDMLSVLNTLDNMGSAQEIVQSMETMTPDVSSGAMQGSRSLNSHFLTAISNRLSYARSGAAMTGIATGDMFQGTGFWMQGLGGHASQGTREGIEGFTANTFGTTIGFDKIITEHLRLGVAGGYGFGAINSKTPGDPKTNINSWQGTIYGSLDSADLWKVRRDREFSKRSVRSQGDRLWYMDAALSFAQNFYDSRRDIWVGPADQRRAKADHGGQQYSTQLEAGYTFMFAKTRSLEVTPFTTLGYNYLRMNKYSETGADALNLHVNGQGFNQLEQGLGLKLAYPFLSQKMGTFIPSIKGAWRFDYIADEFATLASFDGGGPAFSTIGVRPARNAFLLGGEMAFLNDGNMTITGNVDWELKDQYSGFTYYLTVRFDF